MTIQEINNLIDNRILTLDGRVSFLEEQLSQSKYITELEEEIVRLQNIIKDQPQYIKTNKGTINIQ
jgi:uncharacterized coiled-coil protein SlyX